MITLIFAAVISAPTCEPLDVGCRSDDDCRGLHDDSGEPYVCDRGGSRCVLPWPTRDELVQRSAELRAIVESVCKPPPWVTRNHRMTAESCAGYVGSRFACDRWCDPDRLHALLSLVALRESTFRPAKRHALAPDRRASLRAWVRRAWRFGWAVETRRDGSIGAVNPAGAEPPVNASYPEASRWAMGIGLFGLVPALSLDFWDAAAEPEILCRPEISAAVYLLRARKAYAKLAAGVQCPRMPLFSGGLWGYGPPTWTDIHRAASSGQLCPDARSDRAFEARARRIRVFWPGPRDWTSLDPDEEIPIAWLGTIPEDRTAWAERFEPRPAPVVDRNLAPPEILGHDGE